MCTALTMKMTDLYFGRTLDHTRSYREEVTVAPRDLPFKFRHTGELLRHYAIIGMAFVPGEFPLFYDGANEKGLCMAGLNFSRNAVFAKPAPGRDDIAQFEFIPWILGRCASVGEARAAISGMAIVDTPYSAELPTAPLHWIIADAESAIVVESMADGIHVHDAPTGIMANDPAYDIHMENLKRAEAIPGDLSSPSRFIRLAKLKETSASGDTEAERVSQFFHLIATVEQPKGCGKDLNGVPMHTIYTSCLNASHGVYYYKTYDGHSIRSVVLKELEGKEMSRTLV